MTNINAQWSMSEGLKFIETFEKVFFIWESKVQNPSDAGFDHFNLLTLSLSHINLFREINVIS